MRIAVDIMGGDYAPEATVRGAILALPQLKSDTSLVLIGDESKIIEIFKREEADTRKVEIIHSTEVIEMSDYPAKSFKLKPDASIVKGFKLLVSGYVDVFASAGNTGAMMVGAMHMVKTIPGIIRPCITASIPRINLNPVVLVDVGINPDCRPDVLYQYGIIGSLYVKYLFNIENPRVALLNIGEEEEKGNLQTKAAYNLMKGTNDFNFVGNLEPNKLFEDIADVVVCDGFVGNVMLKEAEAFYILLKKLGTNNDFIEKFNFVNYGGTPVLGINKNVVIAHGISDKIAIKNMILFCESLVNSNLLERLKEAFNN